MNRLYSFRVRKSDDSLELFQIDRTRERDKFKELLDDFAIPYEEVQYKRDIKLTRL